MKKDKGAATDGITETGLEVNADKTKYMLLSTTSVV
jgi:hypothetical protein